MSSKDLSITADWMSIRHAFAHGGAMQEAQSVTWKTKAAVGAVGGVALVILKLIDANFYVEDMTSKVAIAAYCTYAGYIVLGMIVAVFLSDHEVPPRKTIRSAFVTGLLAPSMLIAVMTQPPTAVKGTDNLRRLQHITDFFVPSAMAQDSTPQAAGQPPLTVRPASDITIIRKGDLEPRLGDAFLLALGRERPIKSYMFVVGFTEDYGKALKAATAVNAASKDAVGLALPAARVVKFEGGDRFFVTVGSANTFEEASHWKSAAQRGVVSSWLKQPAASKEVARLLLEGQVVDGRDLLAQEKALK